jgi:hypothetical protein
LWLLVAACGCLWLLVAACACLCLLVAACGCLWLLVAAFGCLWLLVCRTPRETNPTGHWGPNYFLIKSLLFAKMYWIYNDPKDPWANNNAK